MLVQPKVSRQMRKNKQFIAHEYYARQSMDYVDTPINVTRVDHKAWVAEYIKNFNPAKISLRWSTDSGMTRNDSSGFQEEPTMTNQMSFLNNIRWTSKDSKIPIIKFPIWDKKIKILRK